MTRRRVIGLVRVSTEQQAADDRGGLLRQREVIDRTIAAQHLDCVEIVSLNWSTNEKVLPVVEAFRLMDEGMTNMAEVARRVGIKARAFHHLIRNPLYSGWRIYDMGSDRKKIISRNGIPYKRKIALPDDKVIKVKVLDPPPVSRERFDRVQLVLAASLKAWKAERADRPTYNILASVARCARCQSRLYFSQDGRSPERLGYYFCAKHNYRKGKAGTCGIANQSKSTVVPATLNFINEFFD